MGQLGFGEERLSSDGLSRNGAVSPETLKPKWSLVCVVRFWLMLRLELAVLSLALLLCDVADPVVADRGEPKSPQHGEPLLSLLPQPNPTVVNPVPQTN